MVDGHSPKRKSARRVCLGLLSTWAIAGLFVWFFQPPSLLSDEVVVIPEMLAKRAWWETPEKVAFLFFGTATFAFSGSFLLFGRRLLPALGFAVLCLVGAQAGLEKLSTDERENQSCANCRSFISQFLQSYAEAHEGWFPRGGRDEFDSLSKAIADEHEVHFFTSHAQAGAARKHWNQTGRLSGETCCYRYNEGLRADDPAGLVVMYYRTPGTWECSHHPTDKVGRVCLLQSLTFGSWEFLRESDFQKRLEWTARFVQERR